MVTLPLAAVGPAGVGHDVAHGRAQELAVRPVQRPDRAGRGGSGRDDVRSLTCAQRPDRHDRRVGRVDAPADQVLKRHDGLAQRQDRIGRQVRIARVPARAGDGDLEVIGRRVDGPGSGRNQFRPGTGAGGARRSSRPAAARRSWRRQRSPARRTALSPRAAGARPAAPPAGRRCRAARPSAARAARWTSWPQACIAPVADDHGDAGLLGDRQRVQLGADSDGRAGLRADADEPPGALRPPGRIGPAESPRPRRPPSWTRPPDSSACRCRSCRSSTAAGSSAASSAASVAARALATGRPGAAGVTKRQAGRRAGRCPHPIMSATRPASAADHARRPRTRR